MMKRGSSANLEGRVPVFWAKGMTFGRGPVVGRREVF